jgi:hypothetical protein
LEGAPADSLMTVLSGWGFRYKSLPDGRRQILNFVMPGDLLGLQSTLLREIHHSAEALTEVRLCLFQRERLWLLYHEHPSLALDVTWLAARQELMLDENLTSVGRRSARERGADCGGTDSPASIRPVRLSPAHGWVKRIGADHSTTIEARRDASKDVEPHAGFRGPRPPRVGTNLLDCKFTFERFEHAPLQFGELDHRRIQNRSRLLASAARRQASPSHVTYSESEESQRRHGAKRSGANQLLQELAVPLN